MAEPLHRTQILLRKDQHQALAELAERQGTSLSGLIRLLVDEQLERRDREAANRIERRLRSLQAIDQHCREALERRGGKTLEVDLVAVIQEVREERDDQLAEQLAAGSG